MNVAYDGQVLHPGDLGFLCESAGQIARLGAWLSLQQQNQFRVDTDSTGQTILRPRFPVSYPLTEENANNWTPHEINKFLLADTRDLVRLARCSARASSFLSALIPWLAFEPVVLSLPGKPSRYRSAAGGTARRHA